MNSSSRFSIFDQYYFSPIVSQVIKPRVRTYNAFVTRLYSYITSLPRYARLTLGAYGSNVVSRIVDVTVEKQ